MTLDAFEKGMVRLRKINPAHEIIPVIEERGYDHLACEYLKMALAEPTPEIDPKRAADNLFKQKSSLYSKRAQLSNKFHDCTNNEQRAEISIAIGSIQTQIIDNHRAIEAYLTTGKMPKAPEKLVLPLDGRRKEKKLHSVRSSLSRFSGLLRKERDPEKIKYYESRLAECERLIRELAA